MQFLEIFFTVHKIKYESIEYPGCLSFYLNVYGLCKDFLSQQDLYLKL